MLTTLKESHPIARKEYICNLCGCKINKGQRYYRQTNLYEGCIYDWMEHEECSHIASELDMYDECDYYYEGLSADCFKDILDEYIYQEHYDDYADDISEDWKRLTRYESVCKILEEFKDKGVRNENNQMTKMRMDI